MELAGWHRRLSHKKMLFFIGSVLLISIAVALHLSPYFPSPFAFFLTSVSSSSSALVVLDDNPESCINSLYNIQWTNNTSLNSSKFSWKWADDNENVLGCDYQKLNSSDMGDLLNGSWVMVAGDSQTRLFMLSFLELLLSKEEMVDVRKDSKWGDYHLDVNRLGLKVDFKLAPFGTNLNDLVAELSRNNTTPDVFVMGYGIWNMLHITNPTHYRNSLRVLNQAITSFLVQLSPKKQPHLFWLNIPTLINPLFNTEKKKERMTDVMQKEYYQELNSSDIFRPGTPFVLLDLKSLSGSCGVECTKDGIHYDTAVHDASVQILLNILISQSQYKV